MTWIFFGACMAVQAPPRLLVDTDAYCKLEAAQLFTDSIKLLGLRVEDCGRLPALPYMLQRGRLRQRLGPEVADTIKAEVARMPVAMKPSDTWLAPLAASDSFDPGEAQLLAVAAEHGRLLLTGDKKAIKYIKDIPGFVEALDGRIIVLEAILADLCQEIGVEDLRSRAGPLLKVDTAVRLSFSDPASSPIEGLLSYFGSIAADAKPLNLWRPSSLGGS